MKATAEKLKQAESKVMDLRNQIQTLKAELKISQKVVILLDSYLEILLFFVLICSNELK